jgi:hypothetical protein
MPKRLPTAWFPQKRPVGRPEFTYGHTVVRTVRAVEEAGGFVGPACGGSGSSDGSNSSRSGGEGGGHSSRGDRSAGGAPREAQELTVAGCFAQAAAAAEATAEAKAAAAAVAAAAAAAI